MTEPTYPSGYKTDNDETHSSHTEGMGTMRTMAQLVNQTTVAKMHPEFRRRVFALMRWCRAHGYPLGIGTAYRSYAQQVALHIANPTGSAAAGNSNHEGTSKTDDRDATAADTVPPFSWTYMRTVLPQFGLICFMSSRNAFDWSAQNRSYGTGSTQEPWHIQPVEMNYARSGRTTRPDLREWPIDPQWLTDAPVAPIPTPTRSPAYTNEDDEMVIYAFTEYTNTFSQNGVALSPEAFNALVAQGAALVVSQPHSQHLQSLLHLSGLNESDLQGR